MNIMQIGYRDVDENGMEEELDRMKDARSMNGVNNREAIPYIRSRLKREIEIDVYPAANNPLTLYQMDSAWFWRVNTLVKMISASDHQQP